MKAGNDKIDLERAEKEAKERARAQIKAAMLAKKMAKENATSSDNLDGDGKEDTGMSGDAVQSKSNKKAAKKAKDVEVEAQTKGSMNKKSRKLGKGDHDEVKHQRRQKKALARLSRIGERGA